MMNSIPLTNDLKIKNDLEGVLGCLILIKNCCIFFHDLKFKIIKIFQLN